MVAYAQQSDVYTYGLPRGALGNPGRLVDSSLAATSTVTLSEHGFATGDPLTFRIPSGTNGSLPAPLVAGTTYYAIYETDSTFQVSATPNGAPITLTSDGVSVIVQKDLPFAQLLERYSRFVDGFLPAHVVPLAAPYPITIVALVAELTARRIQILSGVTSESMDALEASAAKQLQRYASGIPARDAATTQVESNLAVQATSPAGQTPTLQTVMTNDPLNPIQVFSPPSPQDPRGWAVTGSNTLP
jgi:hypothetical protein